MQDYGYFGTDSMTWKVASEAVINLGGARAVLMQLAHPLVAMGVSAHSRYMSDPFGRAESTFVLGQMLTFGATHKVHQAARTINRLHGPVHGTLPAQAGAYKEGTIYSARDPELLLWVYATLVDTILLVYPLFVGPLNHSEQERYYQESKKIAHLLGLAEKDTPTSVDDLLAYVQKMVQSNHLAATPQARQIARHVLFPPTPGIVRPLMHLHLQLTIALLPQPVREIYGFEWGERRQLAFRLSALGVRAVLPHLPERLRILPITRKLMAAA